MIIHNIYIINSDGICPLSLTMGSIEADPELVAGIFSASQKFWGEVTGEAPKSISFQNMNAYIKPFSTGKKDWYLILISEAETSELVKTVEDCIMRVVESHLDMFERFFADTSEIDTIVGDAIIDELAQVPCPHIKKGLFRQVCEIDGSHVEENYCNLVSAATCKTKIREYHKKDASLVDLVDKFFDSLKE